MPKTTRAPRLGPTQPRQFRFTDDEVALIDRLSMVISPDVPITRTAVLRLALNELADRRSKRP